MSAPVKLEAVHLRLGMAALEWTMTDLANHSGISRATISRALCGGGMRPSTVEKLVSVFNAAGLTFLVADETGGAGIRFQPLPQTVA